MEISDTCHTSSFHDRVSPSTVSFRESHCSPNDPAVPVTTSRSVASWNTGQSPGGATGSCSYQLHVQSGQRWKLTLLDFTSVSPKKTATKPNLANEVSATRDVPTCLKYARVQVNNVPVSHTNHSCDVIFKQTITAFQVSI